MFLSIPVFFDFFSPRYPFLFLNTKKDICSCKYLLSFLSLLFFIYLQNHIQSTTFLSFSLPSILLSPLGYALDRLVTVSSIHYCTSTSVLSTSSSSRGLTTRVGISHLEGGFTLRCLQRLSRPGLATLPCTWQCNRYTSGQSTPVLSY